MCLHEIFVSPASVYVAIQIPVYCNKESRVDHSFKEIGKNTIYGQVMRVCIRVLHRPTF